MSFFQILSQFFLSFQCHLIFLHNSSYQRLLNFHPERQWVILLIDWLPVLMQVVKNRMNMLKGHINAHKTLLIRDTLQI